MKKQSMSDITDKAKADLLQKIDDIAAIQEMEFMQQKEIELAFGRDTVRRLKEKMLELTDGGAEAVTDLRLYPGYSDMLEDLDIRGVAQVCRFRCKSQDHMIVLYEEDTWEDGENEDNQETQPVMRTFKISKAEEGIAEYVDGEWKEVTTAVDLHSNTESREKAMDAINSDRIRIMKASKLYEIATDSQKLRLLNMPGSETNLTIAALGLYGEISDERYEEIREPFLPVLLEYPNKDFSFSIVNGDIWLDDHGYAAAKNGNVWDIYQYLDESKVHGIRRGEACVKYADLLRDSNYEAKMKEFANDAKSEEAYIRRVGSTADLVHTIARYSEPNLRCTNNDQSCRDELVIPLSPSFAVHIPGCVNSTGQIIEAAKKQKNGDLTKREQENLNALTKWYGENIPEHEE